MNTPARMWQDADAETKVVCMFYRLKTNKKTPKSLLIPNGEPAHINLELLFNDLFLLRDRFKELGMTIKDGEIYLADLENKDV